MIDRLIPNLLSPAYWRNTWRELLLVWAIVRDPRVPRLIKAIPFLVAVYLLSPFDLIPGFLPIIGQLDDLAVMILALNWFVRLAPSEVVDEYKAEMGLEKVRLGLPI